MPAEVAHVLEEIRDKDLKFFDVRKRIQQRDGQIFKFIRNHGSLAENPKENAYPKIRSDFEKAMTLQQEKCDLANTGLYIIAKHLKTLNKEIERLERDGLIAPATASASDIDLTADTSSRSGRAARSGNATVRKNASPGPSLASRGSTPGIQGPEGSTPTNRPTKRQKTGSVAGSTNGYKATGSKPPSVRLVSPSSGTPINLKDGDLSSTNSTPKNRKEKSAADTIAALIANSGIETSGDGEDEIYCICRQVSFGNMIGCDNPDCKIEWFHYECVGLKEPPDPKSSWYCPLCVKEMEKKGPKDKKRGRTR